MDWWVLCSHLSTSPNPEQVFKNHYKHPLIISLLITTMNKDFYLTALDRQPRIACLNLKHKINANNGN